MMAVCFIVAGAAYQLFMSAVECKVGLLVMIELPDIPAVGRMAACAIGPERLLVVVIIRMATYTARFCMLELLT